MSHAVGAPKLLLGTHLPSEGSDCWAPAAAASVRMSWRRTALPGDASRDADADCAAASAGRLSACAHPRNA